MIRQSGSDEISKKLSRLSIAMQIKLLPAIANHIVLASQRRIDTQTDLTGAAFKARSANTDERIVYKKMLMGLRNKLRVLSITESQAEIGFNGRTARIAAQQQFGLVSHVTKAQNNNAGVTNQSATRKQAVQLIMLGFKVGNQKPTVDTIISKYTIAQAGFALRKLRENAGLSTKDSWDIILPARSFAGVTEDDKKQILAIAVNLLEKS